MRFASRAVWALCSNIKQELHVTTSRPIRRVLNMACDIRGGLIGTKSACVPIHSPATHRQQLVFCSRRARESSCFEYDTQRRVSKEFVDPDRWRCSSFALRSKPSHDDYNHMSRKTTRPVAGVPFKTVTPTSIGQAVARGVGSTSWSDQWLTPTSQCKERASRSKLRAFGCRSLSIPVRRPGHVAIRRSLIRSTQLLRREPSAESVPLRYSQFPGA